MKIVFRVDSSSMAGSGHLSRCLVLAQRFREIPGTLIYFVVRNLKGNVNSLICNRGFELHELPNHGLAERDLNGYERWLSVTQVMDAADTREALKKIRDVQLLVVDSYAIADEWEKLLRPYTKKIMVIDDLANRRHDCDYLLDQSYGGEKTQRYQGLVPLACKTFLGGPYVLLHESYYLQQPKVRSQLHRVIVFFGGSDDTGETLKFLHALHDSSLQRLQFIVVVGNGNSQKEAVELMCNECMNVTYHCQVDNMAELLTNADMAFGAAGSNMWERCVLGLPSIVTVTGDNQRFIAEQVHRTGAIKLLGWYETVYASTYARVLSQIDKLPIARMSKAAFTVIEKSCVDEMINSIREDLW